MKRKQASRARLNRLLAAVFAAMLFIGLFSQIAMLAKVSGRHKQSLAVQREIRELSASADNLSLSLNQYHNLERIAARARQLGMEQPADAQIRVVKLPIQNTSTQSAEAIGAEEILN